MLDQADRLRWLMRGATNPCTRGCAPRANMLVLAGGKGGVGTTTLAVNLAAVLSRNGRRTVLVDGDFGKADASALCGAFDGHGVGEVLAGRRRVEDVLQAGPAGMQVLPGAWANGLMTDCDAADQERLIAQLAGLSHVDQIVVDAGCGMTRVLERFWKSADRLLLATTPEHTSVIDAYAALKALASQYRNVPVEAIVNQAASDEEAHEAHSRLAAACRRFLAIELACAASIASSHEIAAAARLQTPFVLSARDCQAAQIVEQLAQRYLPGEKLESEQTIQAARA